jgi:alpha-methylacyl-CoA racemase
MTGWGQDGPLAARAGHDINYAGLTGALHAIGEAGRAPVPPLNLVADFGGGALYCVMGVLAALVERAGSGLGQVVDAAMVDGVASLLAMTYGFLSAGLWRDDRGANLLDGGAPFYATYACADGGYIAVGALEPQFFAALQQTLGINLPAQHDREQWPAMRAQLEAAFAGRPRDEWAQLFAAVDACVTPVLSLREAPLGEHLQARGSLVDRGGVIQPAAAPRLSRTPGAAGAPGTEPGTLPAATIARWGLAPDLFRL